MAEERTMSRSERLMRERRHDIQAELSTLANGARQDIRAIHDEASHLVQVSDIKDQLLALDTLEQLVNITRKMLTEIEKRQIEHQILGEFIVTQETKEITK